MRKKCIMCDKDFEARQSNYVICSPECRKAKAHENYKRYYALDSERYRWHSKYYYRAHYSPEIKCEICGKNVPREFTGSGRMSRKHFHTDCIIKEAVIAFHEHGGHYPPSDIRVRRAMNNGYTKKDIEEIIENGL